jgi:hypothetical protein
MFEILDAELLEDITADLLIVARAHFGKGMSRFIVPLLALAQKEVEEALSVGAGAKEERVEIHGNT